MFREMLQKIVQQGNRKSLESAAAFEKAAVGLGYGPEDIKKALGEFDGFPVDDDDLADVAGGVAIMPGFVNSSNPGINQPGFVNSTMPGFVNSTMPGDPNAN